MKIRVLVLQLDGSMPNLALMRIAGHHRTQGHCVEFRHARGSEAVERGLYDVPYTHVYASAIFEKTRPVAERLLRVYPRAIVGGSGWNEDAKLADVGIEENTLPDYADFPNFPHSLGFSQRGCRLKCSFCKVQRMEGGIRDGTPISNIWRGEPHPKNLVLLDNDFFGHPEWRNRVQEIRDGGYNVNFSQGINARFLNKETAEAIASLSYWDSDFRRHRLYTAWDNRRDEKRLFDGLECLRTAGVPPGNVMVYVLVGYDHVTKQGRGFITEDDVYRVLKLRQWGADPYPMPFVRTAETRGFQRWLTRFACKRGVTWEEYKRVGLRSDRVEKPSPSLFELSP